MLEQDSITINESTTAIANDTMTSRPARPQTPYQVLRLLPKDATPAQQDSAIQAWFEPGEIHYSSQPDTLHLPGHEIPRDLKKVDLPQYYRENFFSASTLYHPELNGGRNGVAGDPVPYAIHNDHIITGILICSFLLLMFALSDWGDPVFFGEVDVAGADEVMGPLQKGRDHFVLPFQGKPPSAAEFGEFEGIGPVVELLDFLF